MSTGEISIAPDCDLRSDPAARRVRRRPTTVRVHFALDRGVVKTAEGAVAHGAGAAVLTGSCDERWPVERARFEATYEPVAPTAMGDDGLYRHRPSTALARRFDRPFAVALPHGRGTLRGQPGDWLVQYAPGELGVVSGEVFEDTYDLPA